MTKLASFQSVIRPLVTILTVFFFFSVITLGLFENKLAFDRALDILSGIFGWTVGHFFGKRDADKAQGA